jgi:2-polyprenyl-3-methyl-5-hydroxy-6-metoxy-1,4-benzoquinol methylase
MKNVRQVRLRFEKRAAHYDNPWTTFIGEHELRPVRALIPAGALVLDYGCGTGRTTLDLLRRGCTVTAYDLSEAMLAVAVKRAQLAGYQAEWTSSAEALAGRQWPFIACIGVLDYYPDPVPLLRSLAGHLLPDGLLVITVPNAWSPLAWAYALGSRLTVPARPQTATFLRRAGGQAALAVGHTRYAFPPFRWLGLTLVAALTHAGPSVPPGNQ